MYIPCILHSLLSLHIHVHVCDAFVGLDNKILRGHSYDNAKIVTLIAILEHNA